ncbi:MAG TPA: ABC transporter permease [Acidimicrobiales bacterium]|jgi:peptide/nickel transport system permease protein|nr:ABC transporter permease [Acidimicrobiales bacterium]
MVKYIAKRVVLLIIIIFFVSVASFFLVHLLPGNPAVTILGPNDTAQNAAILNHQLGLDKPLIDQYFIWIGHVFQGNLGQSFTTHQTTVSIIKQSFPVDVELIVISQLIAFLVAFPMAMTASRRPNKLFDQVANSTTFGMLALPPFVIAPVFVLLFAVQWHVFPGPASYVPISQNFWSNLHTMLLPSIVLAMGSIVLYFRLLRNDLIATLQEDFITMARSKGLSDRRIMWRHALRPSSVSFLASVGVTIGGLLAGTFVVELLLQLPGLGFQLISSTNQDDYTVVQGITLFVAVAIVLLNFLVDFIFTIVDPRIARD